MPDYRLYFFDAQSGHIKSFREFEADDHAQAIENAGRWRDDGAMELWCGTHKVERWPVVAPSATAFT